MPFVASLARAKMTYLTPFGVSSPARVAVNGEIERVISRQV